MSMKQVFLVLLAVFSLYIIFVTAYLLVIAIAAYFFRKKVVYDGMPLSLAVVIPAHNEEGHIGTTVAHLQRSNYPKTFYSVFVLADNCEDKTAERAVQAGARVFRRTDTSNRGKGQALDWFFRNHRDIYGAFDGIVMVDADTTVHKDFLAEIAASLKHPSVSAVQGYYGVSNGEEHWRSGLMSAAFHVFNHLRPAGYNGIGGTAGLRGNGMGFRTELILRTGWPAYSIVEDYEFTMRLLLEGILVHYNPDAMVFSDMPTERKVAETQRMRWEGRGKDMKNTFVRLFFKKLMKQPKLRDLEALISFFVPPLALLVSGQILLFGVSFLVYPPLATVLSFCFAVDAFYVVSGLVLRGARGTEWRSLLLAPVYMMWKMPLYYKMRQRDPDVWVRTKRPSELTKHFL
ncbi:MAG: Beta-monoglucosyldiacylglycerol synthase [Syntrophorhabdaceae bacterium PtaU1.Bin034]|jgi:glycosyltransferase involved in cell wall biosynthesis|nr:MAG: Beta-monoglucosyldiacylglycerol synthase [Syntrophorhabdaceae bacterium PtaU1.Bin034]